MRLDTVFLLGCTLPTRLLDEEILREVAGLELVLSELELDGRFKLASLDRLPAFRLMPPTDGRLLNDEVDSKESEEPRFSVMRSEFF